MKRNANFVYRSGKEFFVLTLDRNNPNTPIVTRDADWVVSYHRPDGTCANGYSTHHRDIINKVKWDRDYRVSGYQS